MKVNIPTFLLLAASLPLTAAEPPAAKPEPKPKPKIEVCFVLDTTGSMSGLIQGAKDKIWSIANEMASTKPAPEIKFGLIGYRDRGDEYVTRVTPLSDDLDEVYGKLMEFKADGGGDTPESVNQALHEAVTKMEWNADRTVLKLIFLVGDAPPRMDFQDDVKYPDVCQMAVKKDIIINTIQCGNLAETTPFWNEIANKSEGEYAAILQDGGTVAVSTPFDEEIGKLNAALASTVIGYGDRVRQNFIESKLARTRAAAPEAAAERAEFFQKTKAPSAASAKVISGSDDLVALAEEGKVDLKKMAKENLPEELQTLSPEALEATVDKNLAERKRLNAQMETLVQKRAAFLKEETARKADADKVGGFDSQVKSLIKKQAAAKGIDYGTGE
ncbi:MAG: von Willebrand factor type A domain-containing protein [Verrucomicrobia bacterium]|jgi:hypothetical protein|nr:MAG: von Willebrand factor type A domain-containing protein [Verrucomicrobiota bacterium]